MGEAMDCVAFDNVQSRIESKESQGLTALSTQPEIYSTEFYIKFKDLSPAHGDAMLELYCAEIDELGLKSLPEIRNHFKRRKVESLSFSVNGILSDGIIGLVGGGGRVHLLHEDLGISTYPSSAVLKSMFLRPGKNEVECFSTISSKQCVSFYLWLYPSSQRFVVMDIDGTVTRSDARGYLETVYLRTYTYVHKGLATFLSHAQGDLNCAIIYVTSRPISHQTETRNLLAKVSEGDKCLPDGPLFLNRQHTAKAVYSEMVIKKSEALKFKILQDFLYAHALGSGRSRYLQDEYIINRIPKTRLHKKEKHNKTIVTVTTNTNDSENESNIKEISSDSVSSIKDSNEIEHSKVNDNTELIQSQKTTMEQSSSENESMLKLKVDCVDCNIAKPLVNCEFMVLETNDESKLFATQSENIERESNTKLLHTSKSEKLSTHLSSHSDMISTISLGSESSKSLKSYDFQNDMSEFESLFPSHIDCIHPLLHSPIIIGIGNKESDARAYARSNIKSILVINPNSEIRQWIPKDSNSDNVSFAVEPLGFHGYHDDRLITFVCEAIASSVLSISNE